MFSWERRSLCFINTFSVYYQQLRDSLFDSRHIITVKLPNNLNCIIILLLIESKVNMCTNWNCYKFDERIIINLYIVVLANIERWSCKHSSSSHSEVGLWPADESFFPPYHFLVQ